MQESYHVHQSPAKVCPVCQQEKPFNAFHRRTDSSDGYHAICKVCRKEVAQRPVTYVQPSLFFKVCSKCGEEKPIDAFDLHQRGALGRRADCKQCHGEMKHTYRQEHLEEIHARDRKYSSERYWADDEEGEAYRAMIRDGRDRWQERNPDRRREYWNRYNARKKYSVPAEPVSYEAILERDGRFCYICQRDILPDQAIHFDHVIPLARGGSHTMDNIKVTHAICNMRKSDMLLDELTDAVRLRLGIA